MNKKPPTQSTQTTQNETNSPTGRTINIGPEWQQFKFEGNSFDEVIIDDVHESFDTDTFFQPVRDIDYAEIEKRFIGLYSGAVELTQLMKHPDNIFDYEAPSVRLTSDELHKVFKNNPTLFMDKHERQHSNHPTEKNPNHPRFQRQPTQPKRRK